MRADVLVHRHNLSVGAAVARTLERADGGGISGIRIRCGAGQHTAGERRVVTAAVLGMEHEHDVEQHGLGAGIPVLAAKDLQNRLSRGEAGLRNGNGRTLAAHLGGAERLGKGGKTGQTGQQRDGDVDSCSGVMESGSESKA